MTSSARLLNASGYVFEIEYFDSLFIINYINIHNLVCVCMQCSPDQKQENSSNERLRVYANQLENVLSVLQAFEQSTLNYADLQKLRGDIEIVKANANWSSIIVDREPEVNYNNANEDVNANAENREKEVN